MNHAASFTHSSHVANFSAKGELNSALLKLSVSSHNCNAGFSVAVAGKSLSKSFCIVFNFCNIQLGTNNAGRVYDNIFSLNAKLTSRSLSHTQSILCSLSTCTAVSVTRNCDKSLSATVCEMFLSKLYAFCFYTVLSKNTCCITRHF